MHFKQANKRVHLPLRQYDSAFRQTVFFLLNGTSVHHQLNPLLPESQTEVDLFSRVGTSACCTPTSLVPLLQDQVKMYQCFKTRVLNPFSFVPMLQTQGRSVPLIPHLYPCFETRAMSYTPHQGSLYHHTSFVPLLLYLNHLNPCF